MAISINSPRTTDEYFTLSGSLTALVDNLKLAGSDDLVVHCFDTDPSASTDLPAAWFASNTSDIAINMTTVWRSLFQNPLIAKIVDCLLSRTRKDRREFEILSIKRDCVSKLVSRFPSRKSLVWDTIPAAVSGDRIATDTLTRFSRNYRSIFIDDTTISRSETASVEDFVSGLSRSLSLRDVALNYISKVFARLVLGALVHECGHSVFSRFLGTEWFRDLDPYRRSVMTMFEEIRSEASQTTRLGLGPAVIRGAADIVVDPRKTAESFMSGSATDKPENIALNSTLLLGRGLYGVYSEDELGDLNTIVETMVGGERFEEMHNIWRDTIDIYQLETDKLDAVLDRWVELFPSPKDGSGVSSHIITSASTDSEADPEAGDSSPESGDNSESEDTDETEAGSAPEDGSAGGGLDGHSDSRGDDSLPAEVLDAVLDKIVEKGEEVKSTPDVEETMPRAVKSPREAFLDAVRDTKADKMITTKKPSAKDFAAARNLANSLRQLNVSERGKVVTSTHAPPGKLHTRAAMARSVEKRQKAQPTARPWKRTIRTNTHTPPLTVGVMTDVSGSQSWATQTAATLSWVLPRAVSEINGTVAAVTFGQNAQIMSSPGERPTMKKIRQAVDGTEMFCDGLKTLEHMLQLSTRDGVRILVVFTDGIFVAPGELKRAIDDVQQLVDNGVFVLWVTPDSLLGNFGGFPTTPPAATPMTVDQYALSGDKDGTETMKLFNDIAKHITRGLAQQKRV